MQVNPEPRSLSTRDIIRQTRESPLHIMLDPADKPVSSISLWKHNVWCLDGNNYTRVNWAIELPDGSLLTDLQHSQLLNSFKRLQWSLFADPRSGKRMSPNSISTRITGLRAVARWMAENNYFDFSQLEPDSIDRFTQDLINQITSETDELDDTLLSETDMINEADGATDGAEHDDEESLDLESEGVESSSAKAFNRILVSYGYWKRIYTQRSALAEAGVPIIGFDPFKGKSAMTAAKAVVRKIIRSIPPLPDEVALPIMDEAHRWTGIRADDVIRLQELYLSILTPKRGAITKQTIGHKDAACLNTFEFSVEPGQAEPWHPPVKCVPSQNRRRRYTVPTAIIRDLVDTVVQASAIVLQSETGMRVGELVSIPAGYDDVRQEYNAIARRSSISGINELFFIQSSLSKTVETPVKEEWLAGARPIGSDFVPGPYRAVQVLDKLLERWRAQAEAPESGRKLFVNLGLGGALPIWNANVSAYSTYTALRGFKEFVSKRVDLSNLPDKSKLGEDLTAYRDSKGTCVKTHQWRKTWAMYVVRTDRRMIPAIAMQFKHLSIAMTESAYIGTDAGLMRERDSQQARAAAAFMYQAVTGREKVAGRMAKMIDEWLEELRAIVGGKSGVAAISELQEWCELRGIKVYSSPHGKCFIRLASTEAKCHELAETSHWSRKVPNYNTREPDTCNGCKCFGVDSDHTDFWIARYVDYKGSLDAFKSSGMKAGFRIIQERASQSANMLRALGIDLNTLKEECHA